MRAAVGLCAALLVGCGDSVVDHTYRGEPRIRGHLSTLLDGRPAIAWLTPRLEISGITWPDFNERFLEAKVFEAPEAHAAEFPRILPDSGLVALGTWLWVTPWADEEDLRAGEGIIGFHAEPLVYEVSADRFRLLLPLTCPAAPSSLFAAKTDFTITFRRRDGLTADSPFPEGCKDP